MTASETDSPLFVFSPLFVDTGIVLLRHCLE
jgi:hypothetical protein